MKKIYGLILVLSIICLPAYNNLYSQETQAIQEQDTKKKALYRWGFGISGTMRFYPISGGATITAKTPTKIPIVFGLDLYGYKNAFYLGGIFDVWFLTVPISSRGRFYLGVGIAGGYTFTDEDYYDAGVRIPLGLSFGLGDSGRSEFYIDITPSLMYRNAFASNRKQYFAFSPSIGVRFNL